ncbi:MAG: hypothetical protein J6A15_03050, partial [Clostridia bacterium]|nr:hypothetical protein [Clostridia bacterium]
KISLEFEISSNINYKKSYLHKSIDILSLRSFRQRYILVPTSDTSVDQKVGGDFSANLLVYFI